MVASPILDLGSWTNLFRRGLFIHTPETTVDEESDSRSSWSLDIFFVIFSYSSAINIAISAILLVILFDARRRNCQACFYRVDNQIGVWIWMRIQFFGGVVWEWKSVVGFWILHIGFSVLLLTIIYLLVSTNFRFVNSGSIP